MHIIQTHDIHEDVPIRDDCWYPIGAEKGMWTYSSFQSPDNS